MSEFYNELPEGMIRGYWRNIPDEELLKMLKDEIVRIGIDGSPSRTEYQEKYDNSKTPHPNTYLSIFNCTWGELMSKIGYNYDGLSVIAEFGKNNKGKTGRGKWNSMTQENLLDLVVTEIKDKDIRTSNEYIERADRTKAPTYGTIVSLVDGKWSRVKEVYRDKYGIEIDGHASRRGR